MKKLIFPLITASLISYAMADTTIDVPDAIITFTPEHKPVYVTPDVIITYKGRMVIWRADTTGTVNICIKPGYIIPFEEKYMNGRCLVQTNPGTDKIMKAKILMEFKGIPLPTGGYIEVKYSVESGGEILDPVIRIY